MRRFTVLLAISALRTTVAVAPSSAGVSGASPERQPRRAGIVFMRPGTADGYDLWVVRPDGRKLRQLTTAPTGRSDYNPDWSPDGFTVLFERRVLDDSGLPDNLHTVRADGTRLRQITDCADDCWANDEAAWSHDGQRIALDQAVGPQALGWCSIYRDGCPTSTRTARNDRRAKIHPDGTGLHVLPLPVLADSGTWAPDGRHLAFRCQPAPGSYRLCTPDLRSRHLTTFPWPVLSAHPDWTLEGAARGPARA